MGKTAEEGSNSDISLGIFPSNFSIKTRFSPVGEGGHLAPIYMDFQVSTQETSLSVRKSCVSASDHGPLVA